MGNKRARASSVDAQQAKQPRTDSPLTPDPVPAESDNSIANPSTVVEDTPRSGNLHGASDTSPGLQSSPAESTTASNQPESSQASAQRAPVTVDSHLRSYLKPYVIPRINRMLNYCNPSTPCFSIHTAPGNLTWGPAKGGADDLSCYYCLHAEKVKFWVVAEVVKLWFKDFNGHSPKQPAITVKPILMSDKERMELWLGREGNPKPPPLDSDGIRFHCTVADSRTEDHLIPDFDRLRDAREGYRPLSELPPLHHTDLRQDDIVLVEGFFRRAPSLIDSDGFKRTAKKWTQWKSDFELYSVCLLFSVPARARESKEEQVSLYVHLPIISPRIFIGFLPIAERSTPHVSYAE
ncbi:hypothetical protein NM688_g4436 [Phlebia brevispora]|uniref:Uncharacterized protein n=1 Tax=Phlebia brevispora TaxID=194682 RepID=A0ACC1T2Z5_9APHY|nr:hypothetical protein NM688_g4436 [Phlebia brevispora]